MNPIKNLFHEFGTALATMFGLAIICSPALWLLWNHCIAPMTNWASMDFLSAIVINFLWNWLIFFKLQKQNVLVAYPIEEDEENIVQNEDEET